MKKTKKDRHILISGAAGFIGSHLCDHFLAEGWRVVGVDNFITGCMDNIRHLSREPRFHLIRHDISKSLPIAGPIDAVLHFAPPASPPDYLRHPIQTMKVGALGTHNVLGIAKKKRAVFLLASN